MLPNPYAIQAENSLWNPEDHVTFNNNVLSVFMNHAAAGKYESALQCQLEILTLPSRLLLSMTQLVLRAIETNRPSWRHLPLPFPSFSSRLCIPFAGFRVFYSLLESAEGVPASLAGGVLGSKEVKAR